MSLYSDFGPRRTRQIIGDVLALATIAAWVWLGITVYQLVENLAAFGVQMEEAGAGFKETMTEVGQTLGGIPLMLSFVLLSSFINLFMGSASAKWAIMAPVFVPMFMLLGYTPELTQTAYRIGDSTSNIIAPMMSYFALIVAFFERYDKRSGIGTVVATMLPYTVTFFMCWSILLVIWMTLGLPVGPGAGLTLAP